VTVDERNLAAARERLARVKLRDERRGKEPTILHPQTLKRLWGRGAEARLNAMQIEFSWGAP
jgi:hypothetical protein